MIKRKTRINISAGPLMKLANRASQTSMKRQRNDIPSTITSKTYRRDEFKFYHSNDAKPCCILDAISNSFHAPSGETSRSKRPSVKKLYSFRESILLETKVLSSNKLWLAIIKFKNQKSYIYKVVQDNQTSSTFALVSGRARNPFDKEVSSERVNRRNVGKRNRWIRNGRASFP